MSKRVVARARAQVTVEMVIGDSWGPDCPISQIQKQAADSALHELRQGLIIDHLRGFHQKARQHATIIGEPKITAILVDDEPGRTPPHEPNTSPRLTRLRDEVHNPQMDQWLLARSFGAELLQMLGFSEDAAHKAFSEEQHAKLGSTIITTLKDLGLL